MSISNPTISKPQVIINVCYYLTISDVFRLLWTCKKLYSMKDNREVWFRFFQKDMKNIFEQRRKLSKDELLNIETVNPKVVTKDLDHNFEIYLQNLSENLQVWEGETLFGTLYSLHKLIWSLDKFILDLKGVEQSTYDYNSQKIEWTLQYDREYTFWSSVGSDSIEDSEYLIYEIKDGTCLISTIQITAYGTGYGSTKQYYPRSVRFLIGNSIDNYHYISPLYKYAKNLNDQHFFLLPDIVIGNYVKMEFYGKPTMQNSDQRYYIAIKHVCISGCSIGSKLIPDILKPTVQNIAQYSLPLKEN